MKIYKLNGNIKYFVRVKLKLNVLTRATNSQTKVAESTYLVRLISIILL